MTDSTPLAALRALAEAATPGPWCREKYDDDWIVVTGDLVVAQVFNGTDPGETSGKEDAAYIAAANPKAILALIAEVEMWRAFWEQGVTTMESDYAYRQDLSWNCALELVHQQIEAARAATDAAMGDRT